MTTQKSSQVVVSANVNPFLQDNSMNIMATSFGYENPFETKKDEVPADAPEGSYTYKLVQSGPEVPAEECEREAQAIEIVIRWGQSVLHVAHLTPARSFYVGEDQSKGTKCDFFLPEEKLGSRRMPIILADESGKARLVIAAGATGSITLAGEKAQKVSAVIASGKAQPSSALAGAHEIALAEGVKATIEIGGMTFEISTVNAGRAAGRFSLDARGLPYTGLSLLLHAGLLAATALFVPSMAMANDDGMTEDQKYTLAAKLEAIAEREQENKEELTVDNTAKSGPSGGTGAPAMGESGKQGSQVSKNSNGKSGIEGPKDNADVHLSRAQALRDAADFGMIGILNSGLGGDRNTPTVAWGREDSLGNDPKSALGNMWGTTIDEAGGAGGLGLTGIGEGGGGIYEGIGVGRIPTIGHGGGLGDGDEFGWGKSRNGTRPGHVVKSPSLVRVGTPGVNGRIPPEVIQRIVRQNFGRFKLCYENGLRGNASLQGRVAVRFIIGRDGGVVSAENGGSDLPDAGVVSCVARAFYGLSFPQQENEAERGIVTVTYPIVFSPGE